MRIISLIVAVTILVNVLWAQGASAETIKTDTNTNINITLINTYFSTPVALADEGVQTISEAPKSAQDLENEAILARWKEKQANRWANLPKGTFTINASAYTASADECGNSKGITASGIKVHTGTIACPPELPFGVKINIEGYGTFTCEDRGGAIKGNKIDIYVPTKAEAFKFGRRNLTAEIVL